MSRSPHTKLSEQHCASRAWHSAGLATFLQQCWTPHEGRVGLPWQGTASASLFPPRGMAKSPEQLVQPLQNVFKSRQSPAGSGCEEQPCLLWGHTETGEEMLQVLEQGFPCTLEEPTQEQVYPERLQPMGISFSLNNSILLGNG